MQILANNFEGCIANNIDEKLAFHDNQYGFVISGRCGKALYTFMNTVRYFRENNSNVYVCSLDLAKAFHKINHVTLLNKMINKGCKAGVVRVFADWFDKLCGIIKYNNEFSSVFLLGSSVPLRGLLGSKLFNLIIDSVLVELTNNSVGYHIKSVLAGAIAYTHVDDWILLSSSLVSLQYMLDNLSIKAMLKFNSDKCVAAFCGITLSIPKSLKLYDADLQWCKEVLFRRHVFNWINVSS